MGEPSRAAPVRLRSTTRDLLMATTTAIAMMAFGTPGAQAQSDPFATQYTEHAILCSFLVWSDPPRHQRECGGNPRGPYSTLAPGGPANAPTFATRCEDGTEPDGEGGCQEIDPCEENP